MTKLFVCNATQQIQQFTYWLPEMPRHFMHEIPQGGQIQVAARELPRDHIDKILNQHAQYGLKTPSDGLRDLNYSGVSYSIDKAIPLDMLYRLIEHRVFILSEQGRRARESAAIATDEAIVTSFQQNQVPLRLQNLELSVEEKSRDPQDQSPEISEGVRVSHRPNDPQLSPRQRGQARAGSRRARS